MSNAKRARSSMAESRDDSGPAMPRSERTASPSSSRTIVFTRKMNATAWEGVKSWTALILIMPSRNAETVSGIIPLRSASKRPSMPSARVKPTGFVNCASRRPNGPRAPSGYDSSTASNHLLTMDDFFSCKMSLSFIGITFTAGRCPALAAGPLEEQEVLDCFHFLLDLREGNELGPELGAPVLGLR